MCSSVYLVLYADLWFILNYYLFNQFNSINVDNLEKLDIQIIVTIITVKSMADRVR